MSKKQKRLEATVTTIQGRWGAKALRRLKSVDAHVTFPHIPTGFASLDKILGIGGIPRHRITEILGVPTSGAATLALKIVANAQAEGDKATYIDLSQTFNPDYAARCQVNLYNLLLVRPDTGREALEIAQTLIASRATGVLVFNSVTDLLTETHAQQALAVILPQLANALTKSPCALIFLTLQNTHRTKTIEANLSGSALTHYATIRLFIQQERWIKKRRDIRGYRARVKVIKNKLAPAGKKTTITIKFNGTVRGDGT